MTAVGQDNGFPGLTHQANDSASAMTERMQRLPVAVQPDRVTQVPRE